MKQIVSDTMKRIIQKLVLLPADDSGRWKEGGRGAGSGLAEGGRKRKDEKWTVRRLQQRELIAWRRAWVQFTVQRPGGQRVGLTV